MNVSVDIWNLFLVFFYFGYPTQQNKKRRRERDTNNIRLLNWQNDYDVDRHHWSTFYFFFVHCSASFCVSSKCFCLITNITEQRKLDKKAREMRCHTPKKENVVEFYLIFYAVSWRQQHRDNMICDSVISTLSFPHRYLFHFALCFTPGQNGNHIHSLIHTTMMNLNKKNSW